MSQLRNSYITEEHYAFNLATTPGRSNTDRNLDWAVQPFLTGVAFSRFAARFNEP